VLLLVVVVGPDLNKSRTPLSRQYDGSVRRAIRLEDFVISSPALRDYVPASAWKPILQKMSQG
jgi:hypothetical protein